MFTAYIDDSTSAEDMREMVLAGYIQTASAWERFSDDWQSALSVPPSIRYFTMKEAEYFSGEFQGWDETAKRRKVAALADLIDRYEPWSISCHMSLTQWDAIIRPVTPYDLRHPYHHLMTAIITGIARWHAQEGWNGSVDFIFDEKSEVGPELATFKHAIAAALPKRARRVLGQLRHESDLKVLPLQAADLLVWHLRRAGELRFASEVRYEHSKLPGKLHAKAHIDVGRLRGIAAQLSNIKGVDLTRGKRGSIRRDLKRNPYIAIRADRALNPSSVDRVLALISRLLPGKRK